MSTPITDLQRLVDKTSGPPVPTWSFDVATGKYRSTLDGHMLDPDELRQAVELVIEGTKAEARKLVTQLTEKRDDPDALEYFEAAMALLIAALHLSVSAAATGGVPGIMAAAEADLRASMMRERGYLVGFAHDLKLILAGVKGMAVLGDTQIMADLMPTLQNRAASYMDSALMTFERHRYMLYIFLDYTEAARFVHPEAEHCRGCEEQAALGWVPIAEFKPLGDEECGQWCKCTVDYRKMGIHAQISK